ncbi:MAG TPA: polysaccharide deacetylase family protein [Kofleriaceae bacterium]|nr:polysaccharide deacetylase family protein [Kofleriaceae bacterium]
MSRTAWRMALGACIALGACGRTSLSEEDGAFYRWDDRSVHCAAEIDDSDQISMESITAGLDRAQREHSVLELLVHRPGESMSRPNFERLLDEVTARGLPFLTVKDMLAAPAGAGVALMFDDAYPDVWLGVEDLLQTHDAHVTLYITWYTRLQQTQRDQIRQLADAGHDIEAHSVNHVRGSDYVEGHGLDAYLHDEVIPSFEVLRADGYDPVSYAYPFGMRTDEIDRAILDSGYARTVRALVQPNPVREATCPF